MFIVILKSHGVARDSRHTIPKYGPRALSIEQHILKTQKITVHYK
jgi:hypothetical protein